MNEDEAEALLGPERVRQIKDAAVDEAVHEFRENWRPLGMRKSPSIVCLCGSTRFLAEMAVTAWELEKEGEIVLSCHLLPPSYTKTEHHLAEEQGVATKLDELHLRKIDIADRVFILNVGGYIGESTQAELVYAIATHKPMTFLEPELGEDFMQRNAHELGAQAASLVEVKP